jgi:hypothetical protein
MSLLWVVSSYVTSTEGIEVAPQMGMRANLPPRRKGSYEATDAEV